MSFNEWFWLSFLLFYAQYFYNAQSQEYLYWDGASKTYIPVPGGNPVEAQPGAMTAEDQAILANPAADAPLEMKPLVPPLPGGAPAPFTISATGSAGEPAPSSTGAPEKKDDDDAAKKDKEEKPRSLAAVKVAFLLV